MTDAILVLNAGSSSIKFSLFADRHGELELVARGQVEGIHTAPLFVAKDAAGKPVGEKRWQAGEKIGHHGALAYLVDWLKAEYGGTHRLAAIGHRVAHGGTDFAAPIRVDMEAVAKLEKLAPLAPLHQPHNLAPIRAMLERSPELPQIASSIPRCTAPTPRSCRCSACRTSFSTRACAATVFTGSDEYIASVLPRFDERAARGKTVVLHLGNGASMCALEAGRSIASTMGFTAVEGLPMGTRSGSLDPGVLLYLLDERGMDARAIETLIYTQSGLLGISGVSSDMRALHQSSDPRALLAIDFFIYRIGRELGSLAAALGGLDAIVFTAGIGEHDALVRERVCRQAAWLGVELDPRANAEGGPRISTASSRTAAWVIPTNEELMIARHTRDHLAKG